MKKEVPISYRKSFMAKYIMSDDRCKKVYTKIKNKLMSIKGIKSRISWFYDAFNVGRINFAKVSIRGKYLALYLNLNVDDYPINIYHQENVEDRRRFKDTCFKIHVKSDRSLKYAFKLIDDEIKNFNLKTKAIPNENYYLDYEVEEPLIARGLIKISNNKEKKYSYHPTEYLEIDNYQEKIENQSYDNDLIYVDGSKVFIKERKSFQAKLIQSSKECQSYYSKIKNQLLSYTRVKSRISWKYEAFSYSKNKIAKIQIRGKYLVLYFALDKTKYNMKELGLENSSNYELFKDTPLTIRIKNEQRLETALQLISDLKRRFGLEEGFIKENHNFDYEYENNDELKQKGLIKRYAKFGDFSNPIVGQIGEEIQSKKNNSFPVYKEEKRFVIEVDSNNQFIERENIVKIALDGERDVIYLDTIEKNFNDNELVDIESLKSKKLLDYNIKYYKILYRGGTFTKKLKVHANAISPIALKVLEDASCEVIIDAE